jgi:hypothetical protein
VLAAVDGVEPPQHSVRSTSIPTSGCRTAGSSPITSAGLSRTSADPVRPGARRQYFGSAGGRSRTLFSKLAQSAAVVAYV